MRTSERSSMIKTNLKQMFPDCKFSVVKKDVRSITISLMSAPEKYEFQDIELFSRFNGRDFYRTMPERYTKEAFEMMTAVLRMANVDVKIYDTADYGNQPDTYIWLKIGKWKKPFRTTEQIRGARQ